MRIAPGMQWYGGSGILPDTCQRCETRNCEVSSSGQPPSGRSPGRAPRRSWRPLPASTGCPRRTATCSRPPGASTGALSRGHPAASTHPAGHRMSPAGRPRPRRNHRPAATRPAAPGLSGPPRNPATVSTYPGENCPARRGYKVSFFCRIECVEQADIYAPAGMLTHGSASRVVSSAASPVFRIPYAAPAILPDVRLDYAQQQLVCAIYLLARGNYPLQEKMDHVLRASGGNCASSLVSALLLTLG